MLSAPASFFDAANLDADFVAFSEAKFIIYVYSTVKVGYV